MQITKRELLLGIGLLIVIAVLLTRESCNKAKLQEERNFNEALHSTIEFGMNEFGHYSKRMVIMSDNVNDILRVDAGKDSVLIMLQNEVRALKGKLKPGDNVSVFTDSTTINNTTINYYTNGDSSVRRSSYKDAWIDYTIVSKPDSTTLDLQIDNAYSVSIVHDKVKNGKTKKGKDKFKVVPAAIVTAYNPYTRIKDSRTYMVQLPKPPRFGIGVQAGVGITYNGQIMPGVYVGFGFHYTVWHIGGKR